MPTPPDSRRRWLEGVGSLLLALGTAPALVGCAASGLVVERDYALISPPQATQAPGRIEVLEFFWFGCPHCADMHPRMRAWASQLPADVAFSTWPAVFRDSWVAGARLHHTLVAMGEFDRRAGAVFDAVQLDEADLTQEAVLARWVEAQGLDRERFFRVYHSEPVKAQAAVAMQRSKDYQLRGVPAFVVDGRYLTSNSFTGSAPETLAVVDKLIEKVRAERTAKR
ncbi:MAG: thiol:disulfide interchange protein DsbA/DsbL [Rubrivivax sp.]|nr:thiol:disulfide interchange protein DsbA/DsbL [Rubrivivax sp.]